MDAPTLNQRGELLASLVRIVFGQKPFLWLLASVGFFFILDKAVLPWAAGTLSIEGSPLTWVPDLEGLQIGLISFPFLSWYFLRLDFTIREVFDGLGTTDVFPSIEFAKLRKEAEAVLFSYWWVPLCALFGVLGTAYAYVDLWNPALPWWAGSEMPTAWRGPPWAYSLLGWLQRGLAVALAFYAIYAIVNILCRQLTLFYWLHMLWSRLGSKVRLAPYHADEAGGIGAIGQHAMRFSGCLLVMGLMIVMGSLLPLFRGKADGVLAAIDTSMFVSWFVYSFLVAIAFRALLWEPHIHMVRARDKAMTFTQHMDDFLLAEGALSTKADLERMETLKQRRSWCLQDWPTWPLQPPFRRYLELTAVLPVIPGAIEVTYKAVRELAA